MNRLTRRLTCLFAATALLLAGTTAAASAAPTAPASFPPGISCSVHYATSFAETCFVANGDDQWIRDLKANGWTAVVHVQLNYLKDRTCSALPAAEGWGVCKFDHVEDKCVRFELFEKKGNETRNPSAWSRWYHVSNGQLCD